MKPGPRLLLALALLCLPVAAQAGDSRYDRIFQSWDSARTPGCALGITRDGQLQYARGYGSANLELAAAITPRTVFDIGSVSKQFTAMSIVLLAQQGKLSLDDDVHRFIPELPGYGSALRLRDLLHHQSGLASYTDLFDLAGVPEADLTADQDALALVARQTALDFPPGRQFRYSDTNYFLLALVVRRASGLGLREFARRHIVAPLGMRDTHFHDDHAELVPRRATGYAPVPGGGYAIDMSNFEELGDGSVFTTVEDLARWLRNFEAPQVGGPQAVALLREPGVRTDGSRAPYAMGLVIDQYRGHDRVQHTGEWVGYRAALLHFPRDRTGVILLCNSVGALDVLAQAERAADVALGLPPQPAPGLPGAALVRRLAGRYWDPRTLGFLDFVERSGALGLDSGDGDASALRYQGAGVFDSGASTTRFAFDVSSEPVRVTYQSDDGDAVQMLRVEDAAVAGADRLDAFAGTYYSPELGVSWAIELREGRLVRRQWLLPDQILRPVLPDTFTGDLSEGRYTLQFRRDATGGVTGFAVATTMASARAFQRCEAVRAGDAAGPLGMACRLGGPALRPAQGPGAKE